MDPVNAVELEYTIHSRECGGHLVINHTPQFSVEELISARIFFVDSELSSSY